MPYIKAAPIQGDPPPTDTPLMGYSALHGHCFRGKGVAPLEKRRNVFSVALFPCVTHFFLSQVYVVVFVEEVGFFFSSFRSANILFVPLPHQAL